ncbi:bifunctional diaminohydroxyphosphoribosylaminopyrimidine deaminase/5-amino-6-(5-phosphoribosylamino)uracil reductase RibD [Planctomycetota bacterium]
MTNEMHDKFMARALNLARQGYGRVSPNPLAGAVIVKNNEVIGEGYHHQFGGEHAEISAIADATESCRGATIYINLEPCCHEGKTPPCVDAILQHKFSQVVIAMRDLNPLTDGKSVQKLQAAGVEVIEGILQREAEEMNAPFIKLVKTGKPYVIAKWAMTMDGKIATKTGDSKWISSESALDYGHQLRNEVDAVMVGLGTVLKDDPLLTCRRIPDGRNPLRIIFDSRAKLPGGFKILKTAPEVTTYVVVTDEAKDSAINRLEAAGCKILRTPSRFGLVDVDQALKSLAAQDIGIVMIEGGSKLLGSAFDLQEVDELVILLAPKLIGGHGGLPPIGGSGRKAIADAIRIGDLKIQHLGADLVLRGKVSYQPD